MAQRTQTLLGVSLEVLLGFRGLLVGVVFLGAGLMGFPVLTLVTALSPAVSQVWLLVPLLLGVAGLGVVGAWVVLGEDILFARDFAQPATGPAVRPLVEPTLVTRDLTELLEAGEVGASTGPR